MLLLILGLLLFLGIHSIVIVAPNFRAKYRQTYPLIWKSVYSLVSILGFILIVMGYGQSRMTPILIYTTPYWLRHITFLMMIPVFVFFLAPYFPGRISRLTRHPQLMAVKIWAMSHLLVNGMLADILLFVGLLVWAILDLIALNRLPVSNPPNQPKGAPESKWNDFILLGLGIGLYIAFIVTLHGQLIGMPLM
ncbi:MAG: NnrU family protein [Alcaligenaceae bacterium]|nr:NnrU family protein [Alcaligenaceae bacterium]